MLKKLHLSKFMTIETMKFQQVESLDIQHPKEFLKNQLREEFLEIPHMLYRM